MLGITEQNRMNNIVDYSFYAITSLDFAAIAAGRIDTEAARYLRMAHNMVKTRLDLIMKEAKTGPTKRMGDKEINFGVASQPFSPFGDILFISSDDVAKVIDGKDEAAKDLEKVLAGKNEEVEGDLISNLDLIMRIEKSFYKAKISDIFRLVSKTQETFAMNLRNTAGSIQDFILQAVDLLKGKLIQRTELKVCSCCGKLFYGGVEDCDLCGARASLVIKYPFRPRGEVAAMEKAAHEAMGSKM